MCKPWYLIVFSLTFRSDPVTGITFPAVPGSSITLTCNKIPSTDLQWEHWNSKGVIVRSGVPTDSATSSKYEVTQQQDSESLTVSSVTLSDDGEYRCYYSSNVAEAQVMLLNVLVRPYSMGAVSPSFPVSEGTNQVLSCEVRGAKPLPDLKWIRKEYTGKLTDFIGSNEDTYFTNKTGNRKNVLQLKVTRKAYRAVFICQASISFFYTLQSNKSLDVYLVPQTPVISGIASSYDPGSASSLQCVARGARPAAVITWSLDGQIIETVNSLPELSSDGTFLSRSTLLITAPFRQPEALITCTASNQAVEESGVVPPSINTTLTMNYAPTVKLNFTRDVVNEGEDAVLYCIVSSRPLPETSQVKWLKSGTVTSGGRYVVGNASNPFLVIRNVNRYDSGAYRCHVSNHLGDAESDPITMVVQYKPYCSEKMRTKYAVAIGSSVQVRCEVGAFPSDVTFTWIYPGSDGRVSVSITQGLIDPSEPYYAFSYQNITIRGTEDYRAVMCNASNSIGSMLYSCFIHLLPPGPPDAPINCTIVQVTNDTVTLSCKPGFDGGYHQSFLLYQSKYGGAFKLSQIWDVPEFVITGLQPNTSYSFRTCSRNNHFTETKNCSAVLTVRTLTGLLPFSEDDAGSAGIGAYIAIPICLLVIVVFVGLFLVYWRVYRSKRDDKPSSGRVVVARSTGSLVFDSGVQRGKKPKDGMKPNFTDRAPDVYCSRERQLQAIVERIDWQEGLRGVDYMMRGPDYDNHDYSHLELNAGDSSPRLSLQSRTRPDGTTTVSCHLHPKEEDKTSNSGIVNCGFDQSIPIGSPGKKTESRYHLAHTDLETDCEGSSETTLAGMDRYAASGSESGWGSPRKPFGQSEGKSDSGTMHNELQFDGLARSGSYNLAITSNDESSPKSSSTSTIGTLSSFSHLKDSRYLGIKPAYF